MDDGVIRWAGANRETGGSGRGPVGASVVLGVGLGGFVDGIVLHQVLQWHHLLSSTDDHPTDSVAGLEANVLADGLFHAGTWLVVLIGTVMALRLWQAGRLAPPWSRHVGGLLAGWGAFNLVEGVVNHHLLGLHHVRDDVADPMPWDLGFLLFGVLLIAVGSALILRSRDQRIVPA